jgi:DNA adenine methylase
MSFSTPLRYPGGKGRMGPWLAQLMRHNGISGGWYAEPYAGGAGAALFLLMQGYVDHILINDADPVIYAFWRSATKNTKRLIELIRNTPVTMDQWYAQQEVLARPHAHSLVKVGFATFFLNRTNRSGILAGGVIGGKDQSGPFKIDARYNKQDLLARIEQIGAMSKHITVLGEDALQLLRQLPDVLPKKSLTYLDPPYFVKGSQLYRNFYGPKDHRAIANVVKKLKLPVLVTYDDAPEIRELYESVPTTTFSLHYSTHDARPRSTELMFYRNLEISAAPLLTRAKRLPPTRAHEAADVVPHRIHELLA